VPIFTSSFHLLLFFVNIFSVFSKLFAPSLLSPGGVLFCFIDASFNRHFWGIGIYFNILGQFVTKFLVLSRFEKLLPEVR
jgi:hypothetical protein